MGSRFEFLEEVVFKVPLDPRSTQVGFNLQVCIARKQSMSPRTPWQGTIIRALCNIDGGVIKNTREGPLPRLSHLHGLLSLCGLLYIKTIDSH